MLHLVVSQSFIDELQLQGRSLAQDGHTKRYARAFAAMVTDTLMKAYTEEDNRLKKEEAP